LTSWAWIKNQKLGKKALWPLVNLFRARAREGVSVLFVQFRLDSEDLGANFV